MAGRKQVTVEIMSDSVCPWCYIGKKRLDHVIEEFKDKMDVKIKWIPYQLMPAAPKEGRVKKDAMLEKLGPERFEKMVPMVEGAFAEVGLKFSIGGLTGNTLDSHRLIEWAARFDKQHELVEELFNDYFCQEKYIGDVDVLVAAAERVGLDPQAARDWLADPDAGMEEVKVGLTRSRAIGGVPALIIDNKYKLSGAQTTEVLEELFQQIASS